ncbi:hypothetical protein HY030_00030 [Candidatus Gottesmanbacteria bacterium]|nr:hypothetical protein [Candidatus Gottesmanbacteria bacterium]
MENETPHFKIYTHLTQFYSPTWAKKLIRWVYTPLSCFSKNSISGAYLSFFVLIAALGVFLVLILAKNQMKLATSVSHLSGRKNLALSPTPIPFNRNYTTLAFNPSSSRLKVGQTENLNLIIQTGANLVAGVEFTLKFDPSKLEILSVLLFITASIVGTLYLVKQRQETRSKAAPATTLSFSPATATAQIGETVSLSVLINTADNTVSAAELHINYNSAIFQGQEIAAGTFLINVLVQPAISAGNASITIASPPTSPQKGGGTLAVLKLKALKATVGSSKVTFGPSTQVAGIGEGGDVVTSKGEASITVAGAQVSNTPTITPSPTVAVTGTVTITPSVTLTPSPTSSVYQTSTVTPSPTNTPGVGGATSSPTSTPIPSSGSSGGSGVLAVSVQNGQTITNSLPTISGTAAPNSKVTVTIQSDPQTITTYADANGKWSITPSKALAAGSHTLVVTATDASGKTVTQSVNFTVGLPATASFFNTWAMLFLGSLLMFLGFLKLAL